MGIYMAGQKIGYAVDRVEETAGGYSLSDEMVVTMNVMGTSQEMRTITKSVIDASLSLKNFTFSLKSGIADMEVTGEVKGMLLKLKVETAGTTRTVEQPLNDTPHLSTDVELVLIRDGLVPGKKMRLPFFDPVTLSQQYMDVNVEGKEDLKLGDRLVPVYRVREEYSGVVTTVWISPDQGAVKGEGLMGMTFVKETKEQALKKPEGGYAPADIIALSSVPAEGAVPEPRKATYMKARLDIKDTSGLNLCGGTQDYMGGVVTVKADGAEGLPRLGIPVTDPAFKDYLAPGALVQSDDPRIIRKAAEITAGETDAVKAARKLCDWVNASLEKKPVAGIPSAVEVLGNLSGDCNEHTVLYTALARAAGIPAKMDSGIVMMDGRFYFHAWPEVYIGRWVAVDPTFGQFPADATHIRLVEGGPDKQVNIVKLVGKLKVVILESK
jgi:hypothetical protein